MKNGPFNVLIDVMGSFGLPGDQAFMGDWTGSGILRIGVFRNGIWYLDLNGNRRWDGVEGGDGFYQFGLPGDVGVVGDWTGNGITQIGVFRCSEHKVCTWFLDKSGHRTYDGTVATIQYGLDGDIPVVSRWKPGDKADHIGVFRAGAWIIDSNGDGLYEPEDATYAFGVAGDIPVVSQTRRNIGVFRHGIWILDTNGNHRWDPGDAWIYAAMPGDRPVIGEW
jgi:hypothetical protein